jgi:regulator of cell morphogenesis and NO signaling
VTNEVVFAKPVALFAGLDSGPLNEVRAAARARRVEAGATFFRESEPAVAFFVLDTGSVKLTQLAPEGHQVVLRLIGPGDAFGGVAAFGGTTYPITAEAVTDAIALEWPGTVMASLMERHPTLAVNALKFVAARLHELQVQYRQLATEKVERRVARALLWLAQQSGRRVGHGIDFCCGGKTPLGMVCREHGIPFADLVSAIEASALAAPDERDWNTEPLHLLIDHIIATYHDALRKELPSLESMASKVARTHGLSTEHLARLEAIVSELSAELRSHMFKEERVLFPAIRTIEDGLPHGGVRIDAPIAVMEHEHDHAAALLSEIHAITNGYVPPPWACETFRALYNGLSELEAAMHMHVHLENNVLFPRALVLAGITA